MIFLERLFRLEEQQVFARVKFDSLTDTRFLQRAIPFLAEGRVVAVDPDGVDLESFGPSGNHVFDRALENGEFGIVLLKLPIDRFKGFEHEAKSGLASIWMGFDLS